MAGSASKTWLRLISIAILLRVRTRVTMCQAGANVYCALVSVSGVNAPLVTHQSEGIDDTIVQ